MFQPRGLSPRPSPGDRPHCHPSPGVCPRFHSPIRQTMVRDRSHAEISPGLGSVSALGACPPGIRRRGLSPCLGLGVCPRFHPPIRQTMVRDRSHAEVSSGLGGVSAEEVCSFGCDFKFKFYFLTLDGRICFLYHIGASGRNPEGWSGAGRCRSVCRFYISKADLFEGM